jgi:hypothetical protein
MTPMADSMQGDSRRANDSFVVLSISQLKVDRSYQRRYDHGLVLRILSENSGEFDMVWAGPILVNKRKSGGHYVIDGQHRVGMATEAGEKEVIVELLVGLTREEEARLRVARHSRKADNTIEKFHARIASMDPVAIRVMNIVQQAGGGIAEDHNSPHSQIRAVASLEHIHSESDVELADVLYIINQSFGEINSRTASSYTLRGIAWMLTHHDHEIDRNRLIARLKTAGLKKIDHDARLRGVSGGSMWKNYYRAMVVAHNHNTKRDHRITERNG